MVALTLARTSGSRMSSSSSGLIGRSLSRHFRMRSISSTALARFVAYSSATVYGGSRGRVGGGGCGGSGSGSDDAGRGGGGGRLTRVGAINM